MLYSPSTLCLLVLCDRRTSAQKSEDQRDACLWLMNGAVSGGDVFPCVASLSDLVLPSKTYCVRKCDNRIPYTGQKSWQITGFTEN